jgi:hypothetical protein
MPYPKSQEGWAMVIARSHTSLIVRMKERRGKERGGE